MRIAPALHSTLLMALLTSPVVALEQRTPDDRRFANGADPRSALTIETGPNQGTDHTDTLGVIWNYRYITSTITNGGAVPIRVRIALSNEYDHPAAPRYQKYKVFLLPRELTPDTVSLHNNITDGLGDFFDRGLNAPYTLDRTLQPGEYCVVTFGTLYTRDIYCGVVPNALITHSSDLPRKCDTLVNEDIETDSRSALWLKLDCYPRDTPEKCFLIPCARISYSEP